MNLNFDTATLTPTEAQAAILLLSTLFPTSKSQPAPAAAGPVLVPVAGSLNVSEAGDVEVAERPLPVEPATTRHRRTKAEMAAAKDAPADPTSAVAAGAEPTATAESVKTTDANPSGGTAKPISADDLRSLLNTYIKKHGMDEAIAQLKRFGCNRVTEALALDPVKLNELAAALNA